MSAPPGTSREGDDPVRRPSAANDRWVLERRRFWETELDSLEEYLDARARERAEPVA